MTARFTGPYSMPKGSTGRVPATSGGRVPPPYGPGATPMGTPNRGWRWFQTSGSYRQKAAARFFHGASQEAMRRAGYGYMMLASMDPAQTQRASRRWDAFFTQFMPAWTYRDWWFDEWGTVNGNGLPLYNFNSQVSLFCTCFNQPCNPALPRTIPPGLGNNLTQHKIKIGGDPTCGASLHTGVTQLYGTPIVAGVGTIIIGEQWGEPAFGPPSPFGHTIRTWIKTGAAVTYTVVPATRTQPLHWPMEQVQMQPLRDPDALPRTRVLKGYQSYAMSMTITGNGPPVNNPDDVHNELPPSRGEREEKHIDDTGRSIKQVYGGLTEIDDFNKCVLENLKGSRTRQLSGTRRDNFKASTPWARAKQALSEALDGNVNWPAALECMAIENLKDEAIGRTNRAASRRLQNSPYSPRRTSPIGWGSGGFSVRMR